MTGNQSLDLKGIGITSKNAVYLQFNTVYYMSNTTNSVPYTLEEISKLGNVLIFMTERMGALSKTRVLKLVYLLQEASIQRHGLPFFSMPFLVWKYGPVAEDLFVDLSEEHPVLLANFIECETHDCMTFVRGKQAFDDSEFSDNEIALLEEITQIYRNYTADQLVAHTHRKGSLWYQTAREKGVLMYLEQGLMNRTNFEIDFSCLLTDMPQKQHIYEDQLSYLEQSRSLKI